MFILKKFNYSLALSFIVLTGLVFLGVSCDLMTKQEKKFENPYTEKTNQIFDDVSNAVFGNIAENLKDRPLGTVTRDDIMQYANEGYINWARQNNAEIKAFNAGVQISQKVQVYKKRKGSGAKPAVLDSLLNELELNNKQKSYIKNCLLSLKSQERWQI